MRKTNQTHPAAPITTLWPASSGSVAHRLGLVVLGTLALWLTAKVQVPFWPVPMTLQTLAVLLVAATYGPWLGLATIASYLAEGAVGLPVLAGTPERGIGIAYMIGPTGGYLAGWLLAVLVVGWGVSRWRHPLAICALMATGASLILATGYLWLGTLIGWPAALAKGVLPFVLGDGVKTGLAAALTIAMLGGSARPAASR